MQKSVIIMALIIFGLLMVNSCQKNSNALDEGNGTLSIYITDAPAAAYDSVIIYFTEVSAHIDSDWVKVMMEPTRVDLLEWTNGKTLLLGSEEVPAGKYTQVRLKIDSAKVVNGGEPFNLEVPSGAQTGLKFGPQFTINSGINYELVIDFDASRSVFQTGSKKYKLKPRIRVISKAVTGSISGTVSNPEENTYAYAIQGTITEPDTIASALVNMEVGYFMIGFLQEGSYKISIRTPSDKSKDIDNVNVITGANNDLGTIELE